MCRGSNPPDPVVEVNIGRYRNKVRRATLFTDTPLMLETGVSLGPIEVAYETWGSLNRDHSNAVLIVHALTGDSHAASHGPDDKPGWFEGVIGKGRALDSTRYFVVSANWLGSNYGTTGPASINSETGKPWGESFPDITIGDMSRVLKALTEHLEVSAWHSVIGGSVGGMVTLDFISRFPGMVCSAIPIATAFRASPWVIAFHAIMRRIIAIGRDSGDDELLRRSLEAARMVGIVTYRNRQEFINRYHRVRAELNWQDQGCTFAVESYLRHQGKKLDERFDPITYAYLTRAADMFDLGETHGSLALALSRVRCPVCAVGIDTDYLFPLSEQEEIKDAMRERGIDAVLETIVSENGHDGFLIEFDQIGRIINDFFGRLEEKG
jgi:homoserine O-acetyltransferase/O-succinyltransferase